MALFFRLTSEPKKDLADGHSYHQSDRHNAKEAHKDGAEIHFFRSTKSWAIKIDGLCGFQLEAENLHEAIEEIREKFSNRMDVYNIFHPHAIFSGFCSAESIPDGDVFHPEEILYVSSSC